MRWSLTLLLAATGVASATVPEAESRPTRRGPWAHLPPMQEDLSCYGPDAELQIRGGTASGSGGGVGYGAGAGVISRSTAGASAPPPPAAPRPRREERKKATGGRDAFGTTAETIAPPAPTIAPGRGDGNLSAEPSTEAPAGRSFDVRDLSKADEDGVALAPDDRTTRRPPPTGPTVDWGGVVHLSNDDSMSLASAQRLLYALEQDVGFTTDQIRPHELLNYFTFDHARPRSGDVFALTTSAEEVGGELKLAVAVTGATPERDPLDLTLVVDRSGSMSAEGRMAYTQRALRLAADQLHPGDRIDLVMFDHEVCTGMRDFVVGRDDPATLRRHIDRLTPRGSTNLNAGLQEGYRVARDHTQEAGRGQRVMLFTDALLNTGDVDPHTVSEIGRALDDHDIRLTGVGVGRTFRDDVLDRLTEKGRGAYVFLGSERVVDRLFSTGFDALVQTVAHDVRFSIDLPPSLGMTRFYGEESSTDPADVQPVHFHAGNTQVFLQDLAVRDGRVRTQDPITFDVSWDDPVSGRRRGQAFTFTVGEALRADPHNVRKASALMAWTDALYAHALGGDPCGEPLTDYRRSLSGLQDDAELAWVSELLGGWCDLSEPVTSWTEPARTRIRLDADVAIDEVALTCGRETQRHRLSGGDQVVSASLPAGSCLVTLYGAVPMTARVDIPETGADLRCVTRGGRLQCL